MKHEWMIDVLVDLNAYAERNALHGLRLQLADSIAAARREIGRESAHKEGRATSESDAGIIGECNRRSAAGGLA